MPRTQDKPRRGPERALLLLGVLVLTISTVILRFSDGTDSVSPVLGPVGLGVLALSGLAWAIRSFGAGSPARLPTTVGSKRLSADRGLRWRMALTLVLAVGVPLAPAIAVVGMFEEGWMWVSVTLMFGGAGAAAEHALQRRARGSEEDSAQELATVVARLCIRANMAVREMEAHGPLCIVEVRGSRMSRLLRTHPTTADRVARLELMEERLQA